jgi:hypothetical protein
MTVAAAVVLMTFFLGVRDGIKVEMKGTIFRVAMPFSSKISHRFGGSRSRLVSPASL